MKEVTENTQNGFTDSTSYLIAFYDKVTGFVDEGRAVVVNDLT